MTTITGIKITDVQLYKICKALSDENSIDREYAINLASLIAERYERKACIESVKYTSYKGPGQ